MIEYLLGIFWALTYVFVVFGGLYYKSEKRFFMPLIAGALNMAWEINAVLTSRGYWVHLVWLLLDFIILYQNISILSSSKKRCIYIICVLVSILLIYWLFSFNQINGMLISSFVIDIIMACEYVIVIKKLSPHLLIYIGILRTLGDLFAWIANLKHSLFVGIIGALVLLINLFYISISIEFHALTKKRNFK